MQTNLLRLLRRIHDSKDRNLLSRYRAHQGLQAIKHTTQQIMSEKQQQIMIPYKVGLNNRVYIERVINCN